MHTIITGTAKCYKPPSPNGVGIEGCGESVEYKDKLYFYRVGKCIPRDKVAFVKHEGGWNHGVTAKDIEYLAIAWNGKSFCVFATADKQKHLCDWHGLTLKQAKELRAKKLEEATKEMEKFKHLDWDNLL